MLSMCVFCVAVLGFVSPDRVLAQSSSCAPRAVVVDRLNDPFGETRQSIGLITGTRLLEVWASEETGTWTITITTASGLTCILATGVAFDSTYWRGPAPDRGDPL